jgi:predicted metal-binding membrane protein
MNGIQWSRQEKIIIVILIVLSAVAWIITVHHSQSMSGPKSMEMQMSMAMENQPLILEAALFLAMWTIMMIAMMFPAVSPMVLLFRTVHEKRKATSESFIPTWVFVLGYLLVWSFFGVLAYFADRLIGHLAMSSPRLQSYGLVTGGVVLILAGLYQLTPLKNVCLAHCRSPLHFMMHRWREGYLGSLIMGIDHGTYCLGCCWGLMLVLFVVGIMNIAWMGILTLIIFVEKISKHGVTVSKLVGCSLIVLGIVMIVRPAIVSSVL